MEHVLAETRGSLANAEKRRAALMSELEDVRAALDNVSCFKNLTVNGWCYIFWNLNSVNLAVI